jgi:hypothetical protein
MTYNGWSNYQTWVTKLWMDNDYNVSHYVQEQSDYFVTMPTWKFADWLKDYVNTVMLPEISGLAGDLLGFAAAYVYWKEIAENILYEPRQGLIENWEGEIEVLTRKNRRFWLRVIAVDDPDIKQDLFDHIVAILTEIDDYKDMIQEIRDL